MDYSAIAFQPILSSALGFIQNSDWMFVALMIFSIPVVIYCGIGVFRLLALDLDTLWAGWNVAETDRLLGTSSDISGTSPSFQEGYSDFASSHSQSYSEGFNDWYDGFYKQSRDDDPEYRAGGEAARRENS